MEFLKAAENLLFISLHPIRAARAIDIQLKALRDRSDKPRELLWGATSDDLVDLRLVDVDKLVQFDRRLKKLKNQSGVRQFDWSQEDQVRMKQGKMPRTYPWHQDI
jgi:hypothetical protein